MSSRVVACAVAVLVLTGSPAGNARAAADPPHPTVAWQSHTDRDADTMDYDQEAVRSLDASGGAVWSVGGTSADQVVIQRAAADGAVRSTTEITTSITDLRSGAWGAVATAGATVERLGPDGRLRWSTRSSAAADYLGVAVSGGTVFAVGSEPQNPNGSDVRLFVSAFALASGALIRSRVFDAQGGLTSVTVADGRLVAGGYLANRSDPDDESKDVGILVGLDDRSLTTTWADGLHDRGVLRVQDLESDGTDAYWSAGLVRPFDVPSSTTFPRDFGGVGAVTSTGEVTWTRRLGHGESILSDLAVTSEGILVSGGAGDNGLSDGPATSYGIYQPFLELRSFDGDVEWSQIDEDSRDTIRDDQRLPLTAVGDRVFIGSHTRTDRSSPTGTAAVVTALDLPPLADPDLSLRLDDRVYGRHRVGTARPIDVEVRHGASHLAVMRIENRGFGPDQVRIVSCSHTGGVSVRISARGHDITHGARAGTYRTPELASGASLPLVVRVRATRARPGVYGCTLASNSVHDHAAKDRLRLRIVVSP